MKALIFDGSPDGDSTGTRIAGELGRLLASEGYEAEHVVLRRKTIGNCSGCFQCWLKTPGICTLDDDNLELSRKFIASDLLIMLTPVTFGGYSPELKRMLDHFIANISPFFATVNGESHHRKRYESYPDLLVVGWLEQPDEATESVFSHLAWRNSINFYARRSGWGIIRPSAGPVELRERLEGLLQELDRPPAGRLRQLPYVAASGTDVPPRKALLLCGSPRMAKSTSASLGGYLLGGLEAHGLENETVHLYKALHDTRKLAKLLDAVDSADLCVLAFPLYIDSIPAPVLAFMQQVSEHRKTTPSGGGFVAVVNCGFIESRHNETALAICASFAAESRFRWMGAISVGGGEGLVHGRPFAELGGPAIPFRKALDRVAEALAAGNPVPEDARRQLARPFVPAWIYRFVGSMNWKKRARRNGIRHRLGERPYQEA
ncbi:MAG: NAD(P)H-dependent oxidoreductase [Chlorobium sp.]|uniref:NAD(P)H-dependent oxidoreductase n=1 Tax=Chlorobium sp. TaxID=1095 RepID=UPI0025C24262|nr:flavodoxin family protein [Chlorobium sp.]MCF8382265.1 NAD(P)H-dependent oxidoreductase [Chlorobium sp.]